MESEIARFEHARMDVPRTWSKILGITDRSPRFGFRPLAARLLILKIHEAEDFYTITAAAFESDPAKRIAQVQDAWTESARTVPVGVVFVGRATDGTNNLLDEVALAPDAVGVAAELLDADLPQLICALSDNGAEFASRMFQTLGFAGHDIITEIP
jgi:hypothetical protein